MQDRWLITGGARCPQKASSEQGSAGPALQPRIFEDSPANNMSAPQTEPSSNFAAIIASIKRFFAGGKSKKAGRTGTRTTATDSSNSGLAAPTANPQSPISEDAVAATASSPARLDNVNEIPSEGFQADKERDDGGSDKTSSSVTLSSPSDFPKGAAIPNTGTLNKLYATNTSKPGIQQALPHPSDLKWLTSLLNGGTLPLEAPEHRAWCPQFGVLPSGQISSTAACVYCGAEPRRVMVNMGDDKPKPVEGAQLTSVQTSLWFRPEEAGMVMRELEFSGAMSSPTKTRAAGQTRGTQMMQQQANRNRNLLA